MLKALSSHVEQHGGYEEVLFDLRSAGVLDLGPADVLALVGEIKRYEALAGPGRTAWVAQRSHADLVTIANLLSLLVQRGKGSARTRRGFTSIEDAETWLTAQEKQA